MGKLLTPLDDFKSEDLPEKTKPNWKLWGPGAILVGLSIGAGEIIIWPRITAEFGSTMIWAAVLGVFLQMWINLEVGRWTIATGETVYTGFARVWQGFAPIFIMLTLLGWLAPGWGQASGLALKALLVGSDWHLDKSGQATDFLGSKTFWTMLTFLGVALVLFGPKLVYKSVERTVEALVILITVGLIMVAVIAGTASTWRDLGRGMVSIGQISTEGRRQLKVNIAVSGALDQGRVPQELATEIEKALELKEGSVATDAKATFNEKTKRWLIHSGEKTYTVYRVQNYLMVETPGITIKVFFIALVFAGAGGTANLFYTFYLRDKKIGMGARIPEMQNALRGKTEKIPATGYRYEDTEENKKRFKAWWNFIRQDQVIFFWALNTITILLFIFASLAVLYPKGLVPGKDNLISDQAEVLGQTWPGVGTTLFLLVGLATLFSTQLTLVDGCSRSIADIIYTNVPGAQKRQISWWYMVIAGSWIIAACVITAIMEQMGVSNLGFLFSAAYMGGFAMAIYVPLQLYCNLKYLPKSARPGPLSITMMSLAALVYVGFALACIYWEITRLLGWA